MCSVVMHFAGGGWLNLLSALFFFLFLFTSEPDLSLSAACLGGCGEGGANQTAVRVLLPCVALSASDRPAPPCERADPLCCRCRRCRFRLPLRHVPQSVRHGHHNFLAGWTTASGKQTRHTWGGGAKHENRREDTIHAAMRCTRLAAEAAEAEGGRAAAAQRADACAAGEAGYCRAAMEKRKLLAL